MFTPCTMLPFAALAPALHQKLVSPAVGRPLTRDQFLKYYKQHMPEKAAGDVYRWWSSLNAGKAAPGHVVACYANLIRDTHAWPEADPAIACVPMPAPVAEDHERKWGNWLDVDREIDIYTGSNYSAAAEMKLEDRDIKPGGIFRGALIREAAEIVMYCVGYLTHNAGEEFGRKDCIKRGEAKMALSLAQYTAWVNGMQLRVPESFMFAVAGSDPKKPFRVAACGVLPLTENAMERMSRGEIKDFDLTPDDLESPSRYLLIHAMGIEHELLEEVGEGPATAAQMQCLFYQQACLSQGMGPPKVLTAPTNDLYLQRVQAAGFRDLGIRNPYGYPITILDGASPETEVAYRRYLKVIRAFRHNNGWK